MDEFYGQIYEMGQILPKALLLLITSQIELNSFFRYFEALSMEIYKNLPFKV